tara:strand:- start:385 stop:591 length:207 start_codon:yes stop_codon:yes gene_type:complete
MPRKKIIKGVPTPEPVAGEARRSKGRPRGKPNLLSQAMKNAKKDWAKAKAKGTSWISHVKAHHAKLKK